LNARLRPRFGSACFEIALGCEDLNDQDELWSRSSDGGVGGQAGSPARRTKPTRCHKIAFAVIDHVQLDPHRFGTKALQQFFPKFFSATCFWMITPA
jgi:hypothetical protein